MSEDISLLLDEAVMLTPKAVLLDEAGPGSGKFGVVEKHTRIEWGLPRRRALEDMVPGKGVVVSDKGVVLQDQVREVNKKQGWGRSDSKKLRSK